LEAFGSLFESVWLVLSTAWHLLAPWALLGLWGLWWLLAVDWGKMVPTLKQGTWVALLLLGLATVLIWGSLQPAPRSVFGYELFNFTGKAVVIALLYAVAIAAGAIQLGWNRRRGGA
jgi:hypothetical protein